MDIGLATATGGWGLLKHSIFFSLHSPSIVRPLCSNPTNNPGAESSPSHHSSDGLVAIPHSTRFQNSSSSGGAESLGDLGRGFFPDIGSVLML